MDDLLNHLSNNIEFIEMYNEFLNLPSNSKYKSWDDALKKIGFILDINNNNMKEIKYRYTGSFAVEGDHATDIFTLEAILKNDGVTFIYYSSLINELYYENDGIEKKLEYYLDNKSEYIGKEIKFATFDYHLGFYFKTDYIDVYNIITPFTKLAVLLDVEGIRKFPFCNIQDYERIYNVLLYESNFLFDLSEPNEYNYDFNYEYDYNECLKIIVGTSFSQSIDEIIDKIIKIINKLNTKQNHNYAIKILEGIITKFKSISYDEFIELKNTIFDL